MIEMNECELIIQKALEEKRLSLLADEAQRICSLHRIPTPEFQVAVSTDEAVESAKEIGYPVVLKILSPQILHKSNVAGVILSIGNEKELRMEFEKLLANVRSREPSARIVGVLVEKMMPASTEVIVGGIRDSQFGPAVMFGMGGIFAEVYDDVTFRVAPIDEVDALNLVHGLKGSKVLEGIRGNPQVDIDSIIKVLTNVSDLMMEHGRVDQLDLNPIIVYPDAVCAVDCRIVVAEKGEGT
jgi:succinyl-CoA synthetase beta subunit